MAFPLSCVQIATFHILQLVWLFKKHLVTRKYYFANHWRWLLNEVLLFSLGNQLCRAFRHFSCNVTLWPVKEPILLAGTDEWSFLYAKINVLLLFTSQGRQKLWEKWCGWVASEWDCVYVLASHLWSLAVRQAKVTSSASQYVNGCALLFHR